MSFILRKIKLQLKSKKIGISEEGTVDDELFQKWFAISYYMMVYYRIEQHT